MSVHIERLPMPRGFGRHVEHDERSRGFAIEDQVDELLPARSVLHQRWSPILDQGQLGSCTGNAATGLMGCAPFSQSASAAAPFDERFAVDTYSRATRIDGIDGEYPPTDTGSSGLAVAKVLKSEGLIRRYDHVFTVAGLLHTLQLQPVLVGIAWYEAMTQPDEHGVVRIGGEIEGGHEIVCRGYEHGLDDRDSYLFLDNSWSSRWGDAGSFRMSVYTWCQLREQQADVVVPKL